MRVSTKGRYALRVMIELAQRSEEGYISLKEIAEHQGVSMKYLEMIVAVLNKADYVESLRGKNGGYKLARPADDYSIGAILKLTEGSLSPVSCLDDGEVLCEKAADCITLPMWQKLDQIIDDYLESVSLQQLIDQNI
jgi:Rrf2 family protein